MSTLLEVLLGVTGFALIVFGVYGIVRGKFGTPTTGGALGATINVPLSALLVILGLSSLGFAAYLQVTGGTKATEGAPATTPGTATAQPAQSASSAPVSTGETPSPTATSPGNVITLTCSISPGRVRVGMTLNMTYHIYLPAARRVGLGAGLYDDQRKDYSNGNGDVDSIALQQGQN